MKLYALASLLIAGIVATTSYAPRWPTPALDYWIAADAILLRARVEALQNELGRAQGELAAVKAGRYRAPAWWRSIFGGREG